MDELPVLGIFAEAGTGKTMIALSYIYSHLISGDIENVLVVCPAALIPSWRLAIDRMAEFGYSDFDISIVKDSVTITSYTMLWKQNGYYRGYRQYAVRDEINHHWDVVFLDESHRLGDPKSAQTKTALKLALLCDRRYIMTGTPDSGNYVKLYGQIKFLDPTLWKSFRDFDLRYVVTRNHFKKPVTFDVQALEALKHTYGTVARLRECYDMPSMTESDNPVELRSRAVYDDFIHNDVSKYGLDVNVAGIGSVKALQVCSGFYLDGDGNVHELQTDKIPTLMAIIEASDDKIVVFCRYTASIDRIAKTLDKERISYYVFDGRTNEPLWRDFQKDDVRVFITQYQRGSEGIDLFAASRMVFYEPSNSALLLEQSKARIMRKGQISPCVYYHMYCPDTLEEKMMRSVRSGVDVSRKMLDDWALLERKRA